MKQSRPLSPHLTIYKPQITSMLSIFHRITGAFLSISIFAFIMFMKISTYHLGSYPIYIISNFINMFYHPIVIGFFFTLLLSLYYHLFNGIRHLIWDRGSSLEIKSVYSSGYTVITVSILTTIITWLALIN